MKNKLNQAWKILYDAISDTIYHDGIEHAGYIAFLFLLSIFPFIVFFFATVGSFGQTEIGVEFVDILLRNGVVPETLLTALEPRINEIVSGPPQGLLTVAIIGAIWTASSSVEGVRTVLNRAYRVSTPPAYILRRLLSIAQFLILTGAIILVTSIFIVAPNIIEAIHAWVSPTLWDEIKALFISPEQYKSSPYWDAIRYFLTFLTLFSVVCIAYYTIPNIKQSWFAVTPGAGLVVLLWFVCGSLLSNYLDNFEQVHLIYGSLGGIIASLLFFYISGIIFIFGAEFNYRLEYAKKKSIAAK